MVQFVMILFAHFLLDSKHLKKSGKSYQRPRFANYPFFKHHMKQVGPFLQSNDQ